MPLYLVERYVGVLGPESAADAEAVAEDAAGRMRMRGTSVRHVRSVAVPQDEMCLSFVEAPSADVVQEAYRHVGVEIDRVSEAVAATVPRAAASGSNRDR